MNIHVNKAGQLARTSHIPRTNLATFQDFSKETATADQCTHEANAGHLRQTRTRLIELKASQQHIADDKLPVHQVRQGYAGRYHVHAALIGTQVNVVITRDGHKHLGLEQRDLPTRPGNVAICGRYYSWLAKRT
jgi:very-short-patch-repair endonuclease